jgi:predicted membrane-bound spermidine synthase
MSSEEIVKKSPFVWNGGSWLGALLGGSGWALVLGIVLLFEDAISAAVCLGGFVAWNAYGLSLWRRRDKLAAYAGLQRLLLALTAFSAIITVTVNARGISESHTPFGVVSTEMPYRAIALPLIFMLGFFFFQRVVKRTND